MSYNISVTQRLINKFENFLKKSVVHRLQVSGKAVPLQPLSRNNGSDEQKESSLKDFR